MAWNQAEAERRYVVSQFDADTFVVIDQQEDCEICTCSDDEDRADAKERAQKIAAVLNALQAANLN